MDYEKAYKEALADLNLVKRAKEHLKAAVTLLNSIKMANMTALDLTFRTEAKDSIGWADKYLGYIIEKQDEQK